MDTTHAQEAVSWFLTESKKAEDLKAAAEEQLKRVLPVLTKALSGTSGQSEAVQQIIWSLYTGDHLVPLGYTLSGLDTRLAQALAVALQARLFMGADCEELLGLALVDSGEMARLRESLKDNPAGFYPIPQISREKLDRLIQHFEQEGRP